MRDTDEQMRLILERSGSVRRRRRVRALTVGSVCLCLVLIVAVSLALPLAQGTLEAPAGSYASLIQPAPALGYVVIGVLAFVLGACVTLLCTHVAGGKKGNGRDDGR